MFTAIAVDAISFALSALFVHAIRSGDPKPSKTKDASIWTDFRAGLNFIFETTFLRWNALIAATWNLLHNGLLTIFFVYLARDLKLSAATIAIVVFVGSIGSFLGVMVVARINNWLGLGWCIVLSMCIGSVGGILLAMASGSSLLTIIIVGFGYMLINAAEPLFNINVISIRQMITPARLMARTTGSIRFLVWGTLPIGALVAGFMGDAFGGRSTMVLIGVGFLLPAIMTLLSPFRHVRTVSDIKISNSRQEDKEGVLDARR